MSRVSRRLSAEEAAAWARLVQTVTPLAGITRPAPIESATAEPASGPQPDAEAVPSASPRLAATPAPAKRALHGPHGLDAGWDRRLARGHARPDVTLDLHGCTLDQAHARLMQGLSQARTMQARLVLIITGRPRPVEPAERGERRGAIRASVVDWLAASEHASAIATIRSAHRRHGGPGALYLVLRRRG